MPVFPLVQQWLQQKRIAELPEYADKHIVVMLPSSAERYLSSPLFDGMFDDDLLA